MFQRSADSLLSAKLVLTSLLTFSGKALHKSLGVLQLIFTELSVTLSIPATNTHILHTRVDALVLLQSAEDEEFRGTC